ncbi:E3 ubiquitin-protein ligase rad18 [Rhizophlyctis rosea]|nr:E3 ubiquitin-protein ligase rad18 [Rhizophlyctis rosea]
MMDTLVYEFWSNRNKAPRVDKRRPKPSVVYAQENEKSLRKRLKDDSLPTTGTKATLIRRHQEWLKRYNANLDARFPLSDDAIRREVVEWERTVGSGGGSSFGSLSFGGAVGHAAGGGTGGGMGGAHEDTPEDRMAREEHKRSYDVAYRELIEGMRRRREERRKEKEKVKVNGGGSGSGSGGGSGEGDGGVDRDGDVEMGSDGVGGGGQSFVTMTEGGMTNGAPKDDHLRLMAHMASALADRSGTSTGITIPSPLLFSSTTTTTPHIAPSILTLPSIPSLPTPTLPSLIQSSLSIPLGSEAYSEGGVDDEALLGVEVGGVAGVGRDGGLPPPFSSPVRGGDSLVVPETPPRGEGGREG